MFKFIEKIQKANKIRRDIEKYRAKAELMKYKNAMQSQKSNKSVIALKSYTKELQHAEDLKNAVASTLDKNVVVQILENPTVQKLIQAGAIKLMGNGSISTNDDELITLYKKLPDDIKSKVKDFALDYIGKQ